MILAHSFAHRDHFGIIRAPTSQIDCRHMLGYQENTFTEINARAKDIKEHVGKTKSLYRNATALRHQIQNYEISKLASTGVFSIFQRWIHHYSNQWNYLRILRFDWKGTDRANEKIFPENSPGSHICEKAPSRGQQPRMDTFIGRRMTRNRWPIRIISSPIIRQCSGTRSWVGSRMKQQQQRIWATPIP